MSRRQIEFHSAANRWTLTIAPPSEALVAELTALEPQPGNHESSAELVERLIAQVRVVLRTAVHMGGVNNPDGTAAIAPESLTLEEASHLLQALRLEQQGRDPEQVTAIEDARIRNFCARGMGQMQLGALLAFARRAAR
ncbi:MAG TPA: hypothetical protein VFV83_04765 [Chthoniobacteraceae bacterium]|nr:hypothetical protein [Chthoniobacteraceae bacterium]